MMQLGQDLLQQSAHQTQGLYDPVGLVTPAKQKGPILVHRPFQQTNGKSYPVQETWNMALSDDLWEDVIKLFKKYVQLGKITKHLLPHTWYTDKPWTITFSDRSKHAYRAVMYLRWNSDQGSIVRLVKSKAKLTPLDHLRKYFELCSCIQVEKWYNLVNSHILVQYREKSNGCQMSFAKELERFKHICVTVESGSGSACGCDINLSNSWWVNPILIDTVDWLRRMLETEV